MLFAPAIEKHAARAPGMAAGAGWDGPGTPESRRGFSWRELVWRMVFPRRRHRIALTVPGVFLAVLALGIGSAAYNTASNILFITLSLLLACLLLSGLLSWFNFMGLVWRLRPPGPWRAGHETLVTLEIRNQKQWLPTYSLWFDFAVQPLHIPEAPAGGRPLKLREILSAAERHITRGKVALRERIEPAGEAAVEWGVKPMHRGEAVVELSSVGSLFPFGFLRKHLGTDLRQPVLVWPAQIEYQWTGPGAARMGSQGRRVPRHGVGDDLLALRTYHEGDSHRLIHWKASARLGKLMVRQFSAESHDGFVLFLDPSPQLWRRPEQFELVCSLAGTVAEDLFAADQLRGVILPDGKYLDVRRVRDVEAWLDALARLPVPDAAAPEARPLSAASTPPLRHPAYPANNLVTFAPDGARGVAAFVDGSKTASA